MFIAIWYSNDPTLFDTVIEDGLKGVGNVGCFPELCFPPFSVKQVLVGLRKQFMNFVFPLVPVLLALIIIIISS